jgi:hypothetical protein
MDYVEHINIFGADVKQNPCIKGEGAPTTETIADVGFFYMNTLNGDTYKCTAVSEKGTYTWKPTTPLHFIDMPDPLFGSDYETLFERGDTHDQPYRNSFSPDVFSRAPQVGELFDFVFRDPKGRKVFAVAKIIEPMNESGFYPFEMVFATLYYDLTGFTELKEAVNGLETEEWTFLVENADGTTTPITKKVCIKQ